MSGNMMTPIRKSSPQPPSVPVDPSAAFAQNPDLSPRVLQPGDIPVPTGPSQGQERFMQPPPQQPPQMQQRHSGPPDSRLSFMNRDMFGLGGLKDFDLKTLLIVFLITAVVCSSFFVLALRRFVPNSINSEGLLTPVASVLVGVICSVVYLALVFVKNSYLK
jgi:hypothetical protein